MMRVGSVHALGLESYYPDERYLIETLLKHKRAIRVRKILFVVL